MTAHPFPSPRALARIRQTWLKDRITELLVGLAEQEFKTGTMRAYAPASCGFGQIVDSRGRRGPPHLLAPSEALPPTHPAAAFGSFRDSPLYRFSALALFIGLI